MVKNCQQSINVLGICVHESKVCICVQKCLQRISSSRFSLQDFDKKIIPWGKEIKIFSLSECCSIKVVFYYLSIKVIKF